MMLTEKNVNNKYIGHVFLYMHVNPPIWRLYRADLHATHLLRVALRYLWTEFHQLRFMAWQRIEILDAMPSPLPKMPHIKKPITRMGLTQNEWKTTAVDD